MEDECCERRSPEELQSEVAEVDARVWPRLVSLRYPLVVCTILKGKLGDVSTLWNVP